MKKKILTASTNWRTRPRLSASRRRRMKSALCCAGAYIDSVVGDLRQQLDNTYIVDSKGNKRKLRQ